MCWNAPISFSFTCLDSSIIYYLFRRNQGHDATYACFLSCITAQEFAQFIVWMTDSALVTTMTDMDGPAIRHAVQKQNDCSLSKALLALGTFMFPLMIPPVLVWRSHMDQKRSSSNHQTLWIRQISVVLWMILAKRNSG